MTAKNGGKLRNSDPVSLREKAQRLIEQAEQIEKEKFIKIGKLTMKHYESGFEGMDIHQFRKAVEGVLS